MQITGRHVGSIGSGKLAEAQGGAILWNVNVNTAGSGAILKIYNNISAVAADLLLTLDCSLTGSYWYGFYCPKGIFYDLSVASADVSVGVS